MSFKITSEMIDQWGGPFWYKNPENYGHRLYKLPEPGEKGGRPGGDEGQLFRSLANIIRLKNEGKMEESQLEVDKLNQTFVESPANQVVTLQDTFDMIDAANGPLIAMMCLCRKMNRATEETSLWEYSCLGIGSAQLKWKRWPERYRGSVEYLTPSQAKEWMDYWDARGMVHILMSEGIGAIAGLCNCDYPDCIAIRTRLDYGIDPMCVKAEYVAKIDYDRCIGCGDCISRCQFGAMKNEITVKKANIDPYRCFGCGVCQRVCQQKAIELLPRRSFPALREEW